MTAKTFKIAASGGDYTSISAYVSAEAEDLISGGHTHTVTMDTDDLDDNSAFVSFTADATNFVKFIVAAGREHNGQAGNNVIDHVTGSTVFRPVSTLDGMILDGLGVKTDTRVWGRENSPDGVTIENCFFENTGNVDTLLLDSGTASLYLVRNTFVIGGNDAILCLADTEVQFCTVINAQNRGFLIGKIRNCIGMDCTNDDFSQESSGTDFNLDSDNTADGASSVHNETSSDIFVSVTGGSEDLNLKNTTNAANGAGVAISGVTTDYAGNTRADPPDIGAHENIAAVAIPTIHLTMSPYIPA